MQTTKDCTTYSYSDVEFGVSFVDAEYEEILPNLFRPSHIPKLMNGFYIAYYSSRTDTIITVKPIFISGFKLPTLTPKEFLKYKALVKLVKDPKTTLNAILKGRSNDKSIP